MDAAFYLQKTPEKRLSVAERDKKGKYLDSCLQQQKQFPPVCNISQRPVGHIVRGRAEAPGHPPCLQVAATLLSYVRVCPYSGRHHNGNSHSKMKPGKPSADNPDQRPAAPMGGRCRTPYLPLDTQVN